MALGIQKRWVCSSSGVFMTRCRRVCLKLKACVVYVFLKVQSWGSGTVCQHCSCVGHHRGLGDVVEFVSADCAQRPHNPWPRCLQWIQIRWVNVTLLSLHMYLQLWLDITRKNGNTSVYYLPLHQDDLHIDVWLTVWQWWLLRGPSLGLLCSYVLYCKCLLFSSTSWLINLSALQL